MVLKLIGKIGYILVVIGFCMPIACEMNGFQVARFMFDDSMGSSNAIFGILAILMFVAAVVGLIIGILQLTDKKVPIVVDWITTVVSIASGLIVYLGCLKDDALELQSGAYVILTGWITAFIGQILATIGVKKIN